ncbi:hypothetical protein KS4_09460 [Poriferisphaera corsica]|uniref:Glucuronate isomerase n=1 Tax=Poriferisphaera corsica TaxID=2528020 RepID=A0A517YRR4_9BACT|nr:glucuronate isomerase [Poriferisphaera corsica]QDU32907.1 hypothetical protein KS4_09460 [Poriferisphaera corsica]
MQTTNLAQTVRTIISQQRVTDLHTHCFAPAFGYKLSIEKTQGAGLLLWGVDELVTYHYLIAELFRVVGADQITPDQFYGLSKIEQANLIWDELFIKRTPLSEACRGVITTLTKLGLDPNTQSLDPIRQWFSEQDVDSYIDRVMSVAGVDHIVMTNEVFDAAERKLWLSDAEALKRDSRFSPVLRIDKLLNDWPSVCQDLVELEYAVSEPVTPDTLAEIRRFLNDWLDRTEAIYVATSFGPEFRFVPDGSEPTECELIIEHALMPVLAERNLAWALMIGSVRGVNPRLGDAGDMCGKADISSLTNLALRFPENKFMATLLSRESQHELCIAARKFGNLLPFGCWWFLNNPSIIEEMTRERIELLGTSFSPQHSDARILDQLVYKWDHSRQVLSKVLTEKYEDLSRAGWIVTEEHIRNDAERLLRNNFRTFVGMDESAMLRVQKTGQ